MAASKRLALTGGATRGTPARTVQGILSRIRKQSGVNMGTADLRKGLSTVVITATSYGAGDAFKLRVWANPYVGRGASRANTAAAQTALYVDTVSFVNGTNSTAAAVQAALRTATGNSSLTASGDLDAGDCTVTAATNSLLPYIEAVSCAAGSTPCGVTITRSDLSYISGHHQVAATGEGFAGGDTPSQTPSFPGTTGLKGIDSPLGYSVRDYDGSVIGPPTAFSIVATAGTTATIADTEFSGPSGASVFYSIEKTATPPRTGDPAPAIAVDSNGDGSITGLTAATDYVCYAFTQTVGVTGSENNDRVSNPSAPCYFSTP